ncbi:CBS domain-containing protein [Streptomyces sp. SID4917]|nr:CBS domain-containing protein [Streptomyces sp. SID4917]SCG00708.1 CBS domain-containing protein [Streptomyces sp. MnatMP-M17]
MHRTPHTVSDVMTHTVVAVGPHTGFKEIVGTMERWHVSALPVLAGDGRVVGVVSERDLLPKEAGAATAEELMSAPALTVREDATLAQVARTLALMSLKRLPVVDRSGRLQGIVSRCDLRRRHR